MKYSDQNSVIWYIEYVNVVQSIGMLEEFRYLNDVPDLEYTKKICGFIYYTENVSSTF